MKLDLPELNSPAMATRNGRASRASSRPKARTRWGSVVLPTNSSWLHVHLNSDMILRVGACSGPALLSRTELGGWPTEAGRPKARANKSLSGLARLLNCAPIRYKTLELSTNDAFCREIRFRAWIVNRMHPTITCTRDVPRLPAGCTKFVLGSGWKWHCGVSSVAAWSAGYRGPQRR